MAYRIISRFYLCPRCLEAAEEPMPCPRCGGQRIQCRPGAADDPCRKPLLSSSGEVRSHAPLWWLQQSAIQLADRQE